MEGFEKDLVLHIPKSVVALSCTFGSSCLFFRASQCGCQLYFAMRASLLSTHDCGN